MTDQAISRTVADLRMEKHGDVYRFIALTPEAGEWLAEFENQPIEGLPSFGALAVGGVLEASEKQAFVVLECADTDGLEVSK